MAEMRNNETWRLFWAKTNRAAADGLPTRPLWAHLIDVAQAAWLLWNEYVPDSLRRRIARDLSMSVDETGRFLSLWIGLHDLGKAIPSFQALHEMSREKIGNHLSFDRSNRLLHHGHATITMLRAWLRQQSLPPSNEQALEYMAAIVGFHHGKLCTSKTWRSVEARDSLGNTLWQQAQQALAGAVIDAWGRPDLQALSPLQPAPDWLLGFAGWVTLSDWVGSMGEHYEEVEHGADLMTYLNDSARFARRAFEAAGLHVRACLQADTFSQVFPWIEKPRDLQVRLAGLPEADPGASELLIVEAPTGEGKTEAALYRAARQQRGANGQGIYIAMPSQATSNMLFERFRDQFLKHAHPEGVANLRLIHGNDLLHPDLEEMLAQADTIEEVYDEDQRTRSVRTLEWFLPRKRGLLAPYGVGTVDQAFLSVLFARHFFLRLFGLAGKTVIFDEVHAYDHYMSTLFACLLRWLKALGTHVILLSATLPQAMREQFLCAWGGAPKPAEARDVPYPMLWHTTGGEVHFHPFDATPERKQTVTLDWHPHQIEAVAEKVRRWLSQGTAVAVICNTVDRAQQLYAKLKDDLPEADRVLFHGRFPHALRTKIEERVRARFGKSQDQNGTTKPRPPGPALLVATQVAEQSLDFDVDVMLSDLAPIDLLLQRAGRLWRHALPYTRPIERPVFVVLRPEAETRLPDLSELGGWISDRVDHPPIYEPILLWRTLHVLKETGGWQLPRDYRPLIKAVYEEAAEAPADLSEVEQARWRKAVKASADAQEYAKGAAQKRLIYEPHMLKELFKAKRDELAEEDDAGSELHRDFQALTRQGGPSVEVLCLHREKDTLWLNAEATKPALIGFDDTVAPPHLGNAALRALLGTAVRLSSRRVIAALNEHEHPGWDRLCKVNPALRRYRPLVFENSTCTLSENRIIRFDPILGLVYSSTRSTS